MRLRWSGPGSCWGASWRAHKSTRPGTRPTTETRRRSFSPRPPSADRPGQRQEAVRARIVVASASDPTGLAVDAAGNIYFGEVTAPPVRVSLKKRSPAGSVEDLGVVVDTTGGLVSASWTFDVAISAAGDVYYTTPEIRTERWNDHPPRQHHEAGRGRGRRRRRQSRGTGGGCRRQPVFRLHGDRSSARDLDEARCRRHRRGPRDGRRHVQRATSPPPGPSTSRRRHPVTSCSRRRSSRATAGDVVHPGTIAKLGGGTPVENGDSTVGLAVTPDGNVYFGSLTVGPFRVRLRKLNAADGIATDLGTVVDTSAGTVRLGWGFDLATSALTTAP